VAAITPELNVPAKVRQALEEDMGSGDVTAALLPSDALAKGMIVAREPAILCGRDFATEVFRQLSETIVIEWNAGDSDEVIAGEVLCKLEGPAAEILSGERTALNFLQLLSGTATLARRYADAVAGTGARILDTRKTIPGLRAEQKYAVRCGGCHNHRAGLFDAILIKENHIIAAGGIRQAIDAGRAHSPDLMLEIEVESLEELSEALTAKPDRILLDNFGIKNLRRAVEITQGRSELEASGGITLENILSIAETGVDYISVGALTKDVRAIDLSMRLV
jgi:nicotinate-nucleotide pyrophosphorylase (carboxylating)